MSIGESISRQECEHLLTCLASSLNFGIRSGGGVGDVLTTYHPSEGDWITRNFLFDLFYWIWINIVLMNVIFGIIIDTFGELRDLKNDRYEDQCNVCFICNIHRNIFEQEGHNFTRHIKDQHYMWNYLKYMVLVREKDKGDLNGVETFVWANMQNDDISWFPNNKSHLLDSDKEKEEDQSPYALLSHAIKKSNKRLNELEGELAALDGKLHGRFSELRDLKQQMAETKVSFGALAQRMHL